MKLFALALASLLPLAAHADDTITCSGHGETVIVKNSRFSDSVTHNGHLFTECRRINNPNSVGYDCHDRANDMAVMIFVDLVGGKITKGSVSYRIGLRSYGGEEDGTGIDLACK